MKIVNYKSGLGNQLFYYLFTQYLKEMFPNERIYGYYNKKFLKKHNGLEIQKVFDVKLPDATLISDIVAWLCRKLNGIGIPHLKATDSCFDKRAVYFDGWWQDKSYFLNNLNLLKYKKMNIDSINEALLNKITSEFSISVHIRRGDYILPQFVNQYGGIATTEYYNKAIKKVLSLQPEKCPSFYVFSDDIKYVKEHLYIDGAVFVDHNHGENSYKDMFLMSHCQVNILANSSFSYWGAMLNSNPQHTVIYPAKWNNYETPDIFPKEWIAL